MREPAELFEIEDDDRKENQNPTLAKSKIVWLDTANGAITTACDIRFSFYVGKGSEMVFPPHGAKIDLAKITLPSDQLREMQILLHEIRRQAALQDRPELVRLAERANRLTEEALRREEN